MNESLFIFWILGGEIILASLWFLLGWFAHEIYLNRKATRQIEAWNRTRKFFSSRTSKT